MVQTHPGRPRPARRPRGTRRASVRFSPLHEIACSCRLDGEVIAARVCDVSAGGACLLLVGRRVEPGTVLAVEMINGAHTFRCARALSVRRVLQGGGRDALVGGEFDRRLNYEELLPFIV